MSNKTETVIDKLRQGWVSVSDMIKDTGWQAHTLRAAISVYARKHGIELERQRIDGVTSYRVKQ